MRVTPATFLLVGLTLLICVGLFRFIQFRGDKRDVSHEESALNCPVSNGIELDEYMRGSLAQDDPRILTYIKTAGYLSPPDMSKMYHLQEGGKDPSVGQSKVVKEIFGGKRGGFFVEAGALDGETRSNTLMLEKDLGWQGLLVEADPSNYAMVVKKNRKAWTSRSCLAVKPFPHQVVFHQEFNKGKIEKDKLEERHREKKSVKNAVTIQCFPFFSLVSAMGISTVDYFSLDVEGWELEVLKTIPFDRIRIWVLTVEFVHGPNGAEGLEGFMKDKGYQVVTKMTHSLRRANDLIFVHKDFPLNATFPPLIQL